ncbi:agamous-like MADS-box protein AGL80 [Actinidia eriantha]|uniref:agamous-like MADS-box protein AGL80 n=1 Tax=Actinidia eriantha TaxID=165200 RepID=UPI00258CA15D|nr:agamous-like MADS-box protein AGL80 [Actinidia eriantha]XP_057496683.1 agamous-like MADS-box protein AGL80 [Actinidia eriantha]
MARKKVKLAFITNSAARRASLRKRKIGIIKKAEELCTLCDVEACAIIFSSFENDPPEVWPSNLGAQNVITKFRNMPEVEQTKKMANQQSFSRERLDKSEDHLRKQQSDNRQKEVTKIMYGCLDGGDFHDLNLHYLKDLCWLLNKNIKDMTRRIELLKEA